MDNLEKELRELALESRAMAYSPYSGVKIGAAMRTVAGRAYRGCGNVETGNYTLTKHGEETAILAAMVDGALQKNGVSFISQMYLTLSLDATGEPTVCLPCGSCREFVKNFAAVDGEWLIEQLDGTVKRYPFKDFLPWPA